MSSDKPSLVGLVVLIFLIVNCDNIIITAGTTENVWRTAGRLTGLLIHKCMQLGSDGPQEQFLIILQGCLKRRSLIALDRSLKADVIKLTTGVELVRYRGENDTNISRGLSLFGTTYKFDEEESDWKNQVFQRIAHVLNTHVLKIRLNSYKKLKSFISEEGRGRKKQNMFTSMLMFGIAAVGLIIVPMGFQFLAVLGGKALLLAKMALILTAIQGLKKIATSNLNYGLYATTPQHHGHCKGQLCNREFNSLEADDSVFVAVDVDHLSNPGEYDYFWHYDRQWPYEPESHDLVAPQHNYYQVPDQQTDLLHPFHPRAENYRDMM